jgi:hypothetical protein
MNKRNDNCISCSLFTLITSSALKVNRIEKMDRPKEKDFELNCQSDAENCNQV